MKQISVELGERSYPIFIGSDLFSQVDIGRYITGNQVLVVSNDTVAPLYFQALKEKLNIAVDEFILPDGEQYKNMDSLNQIFDHLLSQKHNRSTTLIALGGGVVGDITGFAAACYQRGVNFIQIPTTLLAQVDSSVGGKTAVNHPSGKNMIGAFYQPQVVIADTGTLSTLPDREFRAGLAEVLKYGLIQDVAFFEWLESNVEGVLAREPRCLEYIIEQSCICKARIVSMDERESGIRAILNLGHTFGHAIETCHGYGEWLHGEAVAAGIVMAADLSRRLGMLTSADCGRIESLVAACGLPVSPPDDMTVDSFLSKMSLDKKVVDGQLKLVLLEQIGSAVVSADFSAEMLTEMLQFYTDL